MKKTPIQVIWPANEKTSYKKEARILMLSTLFAVGTMMAVIATWDIFKGFRGSIHAATALGVLSGIIYDMLRKKHRNAWIVLALPWPFLLAYTGLSGILPGFEAWINQIIIRINEVHSGKLNVFSVDATDADARAFMLVFGLLIGQFCWKNVRDNLIGAAVMGCFIWIQLMTISENLSFVAATHLVVSFFGLSVSSKSIKIMHRNMGWLYFIAVGMLIAGIPNTDVGVARYVHDAMFEGLHDARYGKTTLPEGDLNKSSQLHKNNGDMFEISTQQVKSLYLKDYVGSSYSDGQWSQLPYTAYTDENAGMYKWLEAKNFDPLTQVADYYRLCADSDTPEENRVAIDISGACKTYAYAPSGLSAIHTGRFKADNDNGFKSRGFFGEDKYSYSELSSGTPSELEVVEKWVSEPENGEQQNYSEAEAVYRNYVYNNYTEVDDDIAGVVQRLFWSDYEPNNDSIYNAVEHVRKVLRNNEKYSETAVYSGSDEDAIVSFLQDNKEGNAVLFASAGTMALRQHGIPARYAEGYYVTASALQATAASSYSVSSQNAHAWIEVYFDGIGWLPIDVTPGYYLSSADLQQMFTTPEDIQKTAAFDDSMTSAEQTDGNGKDSGKSGKAHKNSPVDVAVVILGIAAIFVIILAIVVFITEIARIFVLWYDRRSIENAKQPQRIRMLEKKMYRLLKLYGIEASLSWKTKETDELISKQIPAVNPGEYLNACKIIEQNVYGGMELAIYQERTLTAFIMKLYEAGKLQNQTIKIKLHYFV